MAMNSATLFDLHALASEFPDRAETFLVDRYLHDSPETSTRLFRVYRPTPAHLHHHSDEQLLILSGRGTFWVGDPSAAQDLGPGSLLIFPRNTPHATPAILEHPRIFLAMDVPRRDPADVHFLDPTQVTPAQFIAPVSPSR